MVTVNARLVADDGQPHPVPVRGVLDLLGGPGYIDGGTTLVGARSFVTAADGTISWDLPVNDDIVPEGTVYQLTFHNVSGPRKRITFAVPPDGPHDLDDLLVDPPGSPQSAALALHVLNHPSGGGTYRHVQSTPSAEWTIPHGLNRRPPVQVQTNDGSKWLIVPEYPDLNTAVVRFPGAAAGVADVG